MCFIPKDLYYKLADWICIEKLIQLLFETNKPKARPSQNYETDRHQLVRIGPCYTLHNKNHQFNSSLAEITRVFYLRSSWKFVSKSTLHEPANITSTPNGRFWFFKIGQRKEIMKLKTWKCLMCISKSLRRSTLFSFKKTESENCWTFLAMVPLVR